MSHATPTGVDRVPDAHFEDRYRAEPDPWRLEHRWYERRKRALTMAALTHERYRRAFEPACGPGLLTELLAERCDELLAVDVAPTAVSTAVSRVADRPHVAVETMAVPDVWPAGRFDLIVLSEVGYYLAPDALVHLRNMVVASLADAGELLAVHYRPDAGEHRSNGDVVHDVLCAARGLIRVASHVDELFRIDVLRIS
ncbi:MAG TPA: SAM-dependent methyltransferase [Euzebyales bacterium]